MENPTRLAIIGCGRVAWEGHLPVYESLPQVKVVAVCDVSRDRGAQFGHRLGLSPGDIYTDYEKVLSRDDVEAISICAPHSLHRELIIRGAEYGKHILCEKPLAVTLAEVDEIADAARSSGVVITVCHNYLFFPANRTTFDLLESGEIGDVMFAQVSALGVGYYSGANGFRPRWRSDMNLSGGGVLIDYGIHPTYLALAYLGNKLPRRIYAVVNRLDDNVEDPVEDFASYVTEFDQGSVIVTVAWGKGTTGGTEVFGSEGSIKFLYGHGESAPHAECKRIHVKGINGEYVKEVPGRPEPGGFFRGCIEDFIRSVSQRREPVVTIDQARRVVEIVLAAYKSAALGEPVDLPLEKEDPVYRHGVLGIRDLDLPSTSVVIRKKLYGA